jgi:hypothetical protein
MTQTSVSYDSLQLDGEAIYWIEGRAEGGRARSLDTDRRRT